MKKLIPLLLLSINLNAANYYFSNSGNDGNPGTQTAPFATLSKFNSFAFQSGDSIFFQSGGTWYGSITPKSGVKISAYGTGFNPVITGMSAVTSWISIGTNLWQSSGTVSGLSSLNMVLVNNEFSPVGKWPTSGYNSLTQSGVGTSITHTLLTSNWVGGTVVIRKTHWILDKSQITSQSGTTINFTNPTSYTAPSGWGWFIQNHPNACDSQNEWWFSSGKLGIFSTTSPTNVQVSSIDNLVILSASNVSINNISFVGANSNLVLLSGSNNVFTNCSFNYAGINGITTQGNNNRISNCTAERINNDFIEGGGKTWIIENNTVHNTGRVAGMGLSGDGKYIALYNIGPNSTIRNNKILSTGYIGIDFRGAAINVTGNVIDSFCTVKDDGAAIYTFTGATPTTYSQRYVTANTVTNGGGASQGTTTTNWDAFGIYMDNNASDVTISDNYIRDIGSAGIFLHGNRNLTITRNVVYNAAVTGPYGQILILTDKTFGAMRNVTVTQNQFISKTASQTAGYFRTDSSNYNKWGRFDSNVYAGNKFVIGGVIATLSSWQNTSGMEIKSVTGSPQTTPPMPPGGQVFKNVAQSKAFIKNNCTSGTGSTVVYMVAAGKYSGSTQAEADQLATNDINNNGQNYANINGTCIPKTIIKVVIYYSDGTTVTQQ